MKIINWNDISDKDRGRILSRGAIGAQESKAEELQAKGRGVLNDVKANGDRALSYYTQLFEGREITQFQVDISDAGEVNALGLAEKKAIEKAFENINAFHELQKPKSLRLEGEGYSLWREYLSIERVGIYVPGGTAPLVSTLLMTACLARIAGCSEVVLVTPPQGKKPIEPAILFAAKLCGISEVYSLGGAQAIGALAYGTESIKKVSKIFGPGNAYVTEAKIQVSQDRAGCPIDMPAGPSEVLVIADGDANPSFVASDLLAQAEHDPESKGVLVSTSLELIYKVQSELMSQSKTLSRGTILQSSMPEILLILVKDNLEAMEVSNAYAPEHLLIQTKDPLSLASKVKNAGSVFIGPWSAESLGDYVTGPNHVLPTSGYARSVGGLSVEHFMKSTTFQHVKEDGFSALAQPAKILGGLEGLDGHQESLAIRLRALEAVFLKKNES